MPHGAGAVLWHVVLLVAVWSAVSAVPVAEAKEGLLVGVEVFYLDLRLINSRDVLFEVNVEIVYQWENATVTPDTPPADIEPPRIEIANLVKREVVYPTVLTPGNGVVKMTTRQVR